SVTVLIISLALARIGQHFVSLVGFLEALFGCLVPGITVRVVLHGKAAISFFQLCIAGATLDTEHFVIITFGHNFPEPSIRTLQTHIRGSKPPRSGHTCRNLPQQAGAEDSSRSRRLLHFPHPRGSQAGAYLLSLTSSNSASTTSSPGCAPSSAGWPSPPCGCSAYIFCASGVEAWETAAILASISALSSPLMATSSSPIAFSMDALSSSLALSPASVSILRVAWPSWSPWLLVPASSSYLTSFSA